ncbi:MAG: hypothetical protein AB8D78_15475 [Akkermansiaceae bacterium]
MKPYFILALTLTVPLQAQQEVKRPFRDAATHASLLPEFKKSQIQSPVRKFEPAVGEDATKTNLPSNLIERSDVISFNGTTTLVPKLSIIQIPKKFESRINNHTPGNRIMRWNEFYSLNRGWITVVNVSRIQAEGKEPIDPAIVEIYSKSNNLVIAIYMDGPISILPPKEETPSIQTANKDSE